MSLESANDLRVPLDVQIDIFNRDALLLHVRHDALDAEAVDLGGGHELPVHRERPRARRLCTASCRVCDGVQAGAAWLVLLRRAR